MSYDENRISDLIDGGLKHQEESIRIDYDQYGLIMTDTFRYFIRKNFPEFGNEISNDDIDEIGIEFHKHLDSKLSEEQKERILPKNAMTIIMQSDHPLKTNGFEPAYVLHFTQWIKEQSEAQS